MNAPVRGRRGGFTMLEVLAALTVFLIGVMGVLSLLGSGTRLHQASQNQIEMAAAFEAAQWQAQAALAMAPPAAGLPAGGPAPLAGHPGFQYRWQLVAADLPPPYLLEVEVLWKEGGTERSQKAVSVLPAAQALSQAVRQRQ